MSMVEFSVLMSVYANENPKFLSQAMESIFNQTLQPSEVILIEDGILTAELHTVIENYQLAKPVIKVYKLPQNVGLGSALNYGLTLCKFDLVARMDSDDVAHNDRFEKQITFLNQNPEVHVLGGHIHEFEVEPGDMNKQKKVPITKEDVIQFARLRNPVNHPTVVFRKEAILSVGSYRHMPLFEDYYLWLRLLKAGFCIENLDSEVLYFRVTNMYKRRHGLAYFKHEIHFFKTLKAEGLISYWEYLTMLGIRLPFRILPRRLLSFFYNNFLREGGIISNLLKKS
jgi:glycosyltransferase involved in cell wall biosynthesis